MTEPDSLTLRYLRSIDTKLDHIIERLSTLERQSAQLRGDVDRLLFAAACQPARGVEHA